MINFFGIKLNVQELFIGSCLQFPLIFILGWWVVPLMIFCGLLWSLGGAEGSSKLFRRIGVPLSVTGAVFLNTHHYQVFFAIPFLTWIAPSYGKDSWLYKFVLKYLVVQEDSKLADFITRMICYIWYWSAIGIALLF